MFRPIGCALAITLLVATVVSAQTIRFKTNAGDFDLVLNPTGNPLLQEHVDNMLQYVLSGRYDSTVINRAVEGFVLQMGSYRVLSPELPETIDGFISIEAFDPVAGVPAAEIGLSNTNGMVGLALPGGAGGTNQDGGRSSFYINLGNNSFLDADFTIFAQVANMATIDAIMALPQVDLTEVPSFGAPPSHLAFTDVPLLPGDNLVVISRAIVVPEPAAITLVCCVLALSVSCKSRHLSRRYP
jgi:cyclophilin family peptidyl-prolyl cis-trans isomerase